MWELKRGYELQDYDPVFLLGKRKKDREAKVNGKCSVFDSESFTVNVFDWSN